MNGGYIGNVLRVDLTARKTEELGLPSDEVLKKYVGGWGLALRYLYDLLPPGYTATDPENPLVFMTGPFTGLNLPGATNITLATKNFNTAFTVGRSHTHGSFGILMKAAGYDGMIVTGQSAEPVYLWLHNGTVEFRDASHLWGKDTHETEDAIKKELANPKVSVAAIGPCGENLVVGGAIMNDKNHGFCHSGVGSVMGSKRVKAIAIFGTGSIPVADVQKLSACRKEWLNRFKEPSHIAGRMTGQTRLKQEYRGMLQFAGYCGKNFTANQFAEFGLGWSKHKFTAKTCPRCPIGCPYDLEIAEGPYKGYVATLCGGSEGLEAAGSVLGVTEPGTPFYLCDVYDRLGIEASMAGCTIAMAIEAYEKGLITARDTDGLELKWGDGQLAEALVRKMVNREGFGNILAHGVKRAAELIGGNAPSFAINIKGSAMNLHEWRSAWGVLLGQIVSSGAGWPAPGADAYAPQPDAGYPQLTERFQYHAKPMEAKLTGIIKFLIDSTGFCWFSAWGCRDMMQLTAETLNAATGSDWTKEELFAVGERLMHVERAFNVRHGLRPEDDWTVPERLVSAPDAGPAKGISVKPYLEGMVKEYHRLMGWDPKTGKPFRTTLKKMGIDDVAQDLWE